MNPTDDAARLRAALVENDILRNLDALNLRPEAVRDLVDRLIKAGAQPGITGVKMPSGGPALDYAADVILPEAAHLLRPGPATPAAATPAPKATPIKSKTPGRPTASEKLFSVNGTDEASR